MLPPLTVVKFANIKVMEYFGIGMLKMLMHIFILCIVIVHHIIAQFSLDILEEHHKD